MPKSIVLAIALILLLKTIRVSAAPADPEPAIYIESDGRATPPLYLLGDEHNHHMSDAQGYTIVKDKQGMFVYAEKNRNGKLVSTRARVGLKDPRTLGLVKNLMPNDNVRPDNALVVYDDGIRFKPKGSDGKRQLWVSPAAPLCGAPGHACTVEHLVVLVKFADHQTRVLPSQAAFDKLFNNDGDGTVKDYFFVNSNGAMNIESHVTDWIQVSQTEEYAVANEIDAETGEKIVYNGLNRPQTRTVWKEALEQLEDTYNFDFSQFDSNGDGDIDMLTIVHSGVAAERSGNCGGTEKSPDDRIWSHSARGEFFHSGSGIQNYGFSVASGLWGDCPTGDIAHLGVLVHEMAHQW
jgi:immune inhibitor A